jgi:hypothetical protein
MPAVAPFHQVNMVLKMLDTGLDCSRRGLNAAGL